MRKQATARHPGRPQSGMPGRHHATGAPARSRDRQTRVAHTNADEAIRFSSCLSQQQKPSRAGIWHPSVMQFYSGPLMHFLPGVDKSTFLAKFTIVPIPIWLELEKDRPVRPHSGYSPSATATGSFATGTDGSNRSPSASESVVNERQIEFGEMRRGEFDRLPVQDVGGAGDPRSRPTGSRNTQISRKLRSLCECCGCVSLRSALASICRIRSRVTENWFPTSSKV